MFTRVHKKKDQVGQCMSLRGAKRRGNLPVQSLVIEALKVSVGPTPEKSSKTEHFTRRLPRPDGLAMTTRGKLARIRRNAYLESVPTDCPPSVILPCFAWQNDSSPMLTHRGAFSYPQSCTIASASAIAAGLASSRVFPAAPISTSRVRGPRCWL